MSEVNKAITLQQAKTLYDDLRQRQENIPSAENIVMVQDQQPTVPANKVWLTETPPAGVDVPTYQEFTGVIAPDYADLDFPVSAGEHCIHNGVLYTAIQNINASEAWTAAHWEAGSVSSKLTEISTAIQGVEDIIKIEVEYPASEIIQGTYKANGDVDSNNKRIRTASPIKCPKGSCLTFAAGSNAAAIFLGLSTNGGTSYRDTSWVSESETMYFDEDTLVIAVFKNSGGTNISPSDYDATLNIVAPYKEEINTVTIEGGGIESNDELTYLRADYTSYNRTAFYIDLKGASIIKTLLTGLTVSTFTMRFYNSSMTLLSYETRTSGMDKYYFVPKNTKYVRFSFHCTNKITNIQMITIGNTENVEETKRNQRGDPSDRITYKVTENTITTARLILPYNYTTKGAKSPLILWMDGSYVFESWNSDFSNNKLPYLQYLANEGFAVLSVFAWGNKYYVKYDNVGRSYPYPVPICLECIKKGIEYVLDRYNVDKDNIHIMCKSQGGQVALYMASRPMFNIRSIGMFSPVLDYLSMPGDSIYADTRKAIAEELGLTGDTTYFGSTSFNAYSADAKAFWLENLQKINGLNEAWTNLGETLAQKYEKSIENGEAYWTDKTDQSIYQDTDLIKYASVPVKIWGAADDEDTPYLKMVEVVSQLANGGTEAHMRTFSNNTGKHNCADMGTNVEASVTAESGVVYTDLPSGWYENVQWMRSKMPIRPV